MTLYRRKVTTIEAIQWHENLDHPGVEHDEHGAYVTTIHDQRAYLAVGDWILPESIPGLFYPCKPDVFAANYEEVQP